ncbi:hypothetical protein [uncultured Jatrophihabitans sp.]|uniref:hypothetical protein n=1 Tax=uncultured Jatrophihabitans sp. TaxID=1610747 RepID=UPI0035CA8497
MVKIAIVLVVVFVIFFIGAYPDAASSIYWHSWHAAVNVTHGIGRFVDKLAS